MAFRWREIVALDRMLAGLPLAVELVLQLSEYGTSGNNLIYCTYKINIAAFRLLATNLYCHNTVMFRFFLKGKFTTLLNAFIIELTVW